MPDMTNLSPSSLFENHSIERVTEALQTVDGDGDGDGGVVRKLQMAESVMPRVSGFFCLASSILILGMAWKRRQCLFHRLVLGTKQTFVRVNETTTRKTTVFFSNTTCSLLVTPSPFVYVMSWGTQAWPYTCLW